MVYKEHCPFKCLAKKESFSKSLMNEDSQNSVSSETKSLSKLKRLQSERFLEGNKLNSITLSGRISHSCQKEKYFCLNRTSAIE